MTQCFPAGVLSIISYRSFRTRDFPHLFDGVCFLCVYIYVCVYTHKAAIPSPFWQPLHSFSSSFSSIFLLQEERRKIRLLTTTTTTYPFRHHKNLVSTNATMACVEEKWYNNRSVCDGTCNIVMLPSLSNWANERVCVINSDSIVVTAERVFLIRKSIGSLAISSSSHCHFSSKYTYSMCQGLDFTFLIHFFSGCLAFLVSYCKWITIYFIRSAVFRGRSVERSHWWPSEGLFDLLPLLVRGCSWRALLLPIEEINSRKKDDGREGWICLNEHGSGVLCYLGRWKHTGHWSYVIVAAKGKSSILSLGFIMGLRYLDEAAQGYLPDFLMS